MSDETRPPPTLYRRAWWRGLDPRSAADRHRAAAVARGYARAARWAVRPPSTGGRERVVIALTGHMGDVVAAEPIARWARSRYPDAHITWIVRDRYAALVQGHEALDDVYETGCVTEWLALRERHTFDRLLDLHVRGRSCDVCQLGLRREDGDANLDIRNYYDVGSLLEVFCRSAGIPVLDEAPRLRVPEAAVRRVDALALPDDYVVVHARSNQVARDWRDDGWRALFERFASQSMPPVVEVGLDPVGRGSPGVTDLCARLDLLETAEVIRRARLFVGIDSGPAHLANAVGTPGVLLLGRFAAFERYMPYTGPYAEEGATRLWSDGPAADLAVDDVHDAVMVGLSRASR